MAIYESAEYPMAMEVNIVDYLRDNGYELRREGDNYAVITHDGSGEHDSLKVSIDGKKWNWFTHNVGGVSPIKLVSILDEIEKPYAIRKLADYAKGYASAAPREREKVKIEEKENLKPFELPEKWSDNKRAFAYLSKNRGLDDEVINYCIDQGLIYESKKFHNVVFVGQKNEAGEVKHASLRGTYSNVEKPFKGDVTGSNKDYSFALEGRGNHVCIYESSIDALSHASIEKIEGKDWKQTHRVTLGGMSDRPLELFLQKHPEVKSITFCLDNDIDGKDEKGNPRNHGQIRADNLMKKYQENGLEVNKFIPESKDVNEDLKKIRNKSGQSVDSTQVEKVQPEKEVTEIGNKNILDKLTEGVASTFTSQNYLEYLKVMSKFHSYSVNNCLLISIQNPNATRVAGYNAWNKMFGRQVKKGEKGIQILAPAEYKHMDMVDEIDPKTGETTKKKVETSKKYFKPVKVFDVTQTDGKELPELTSELDFTVENSKAFLGAIKKIAESSSVSFTLENIQGGAKGYFSALKNKIAVKENMSDAQTIKTAVHELAHSRLHIPSADLEKTSRNTKEVEAESIAFVVANHFGIDTSNYSFPYIASWSSGKETKELKNSLDTIRKESTDIIKKIEKEIGINQEVELAKKENLQVKKVTESKKKQGTNKSRLKENKQAEKVESENLISIKNYEHSLTILAQNIPLFLRKEDKYILIKSEKEIMSSSETTYLKSQDLEKNKVLIPKIYNSYLVRLFNDAFNKNPVEAMKLFEIDKLIEGNFAKAFICNDNLIKKDLSKGESINDCIEIISKRLEVAKKIGGNAIIHIKSSDSSKFKDGEILSFSEANKKFQLLERESRDKKSKANEGKGEYAGYDKTKFVLYIRNNQKWIMGELRYDIGDGYADNLINFIEKNVGGNVAETCRQELEKNKKEVTKSVKREEQIK